MPIIMVSNTRNASIYSLTRVVMLSQLAITQIGVKTVANKTKNSEIHQPPWHSADQFLVSS